MSDLLSISDVPLSALRRPTMKLFSAMLNPEKVIPTDENISRDWIGLAQLVSIPGVYNSSLRQSVDPTVMIIETWIHKKDGTSTVGRLIKYLEKLDRYDVIDDLTDILLEDAEVFFKESTRPLQINLKDERLTYQDVLSNEIQYYHAFIVYSKEDEDFAAQMVTILRGQGYRICTKHDLIAGFHTQYEPVSRLMTERCKHVIVIFSPDFLQSSENAFFIDYAQALGIERNVRKLLPCMYRECVPPLNVKMYSCLYYTRNENSLFYNFWEKLAASIDSTELRRLPVKHTQKAIEQQDNLVKPVVEHKIVEKKVDQLKEKPPMSGSLNDLTSKSKGTIMNTIKRKLKLKKKRSIAIALVD